MLSLVLTYQATLKSLSYAKISHVVKRENLKESHTKKRKGMQSRFDFFDMKTSQVSWSKTRNLKVLDIHTLVSLLSTITARFVLS